MLLRALACVLALLLCLAAVACGSSNSGGQPPNWSQLIANAQNGNGGGNQSGNEIPITVTVSGGVPTYSWTGGGVQSLTIVRTSNPAMPVWIVATPGRDGVTSPLTQGAVPAGAVEGIATERTLVPGVEYRVSIARIATNNAGWAEFTP